MEEKERQEIRLIEAFNMLETQLKELRVKESLLGTQENRVEKINELTNKLETVKQQIIDLNYYTVTWRKTTAIRNYLTELLRFFNSIPEQYQLSLSQGTILDFYVFGKISNDVEGAFKSSYGGYPRPDLYWEDNQGFNMKKLTDFIDRQLRLIQENPPHNYAELHEYYFSFKEELIGVIDEYRVEHRND